MLKSSVRLITVISLGVGLATFGCEKVTGPGEKLPIHPNLSNVTFVQIGFSEYRAFFGSDSSFVSSDIYLIEIGVVDSTGFSIRDSIVGIFDESLRAFRTNFNAVVGFDPSQPTTTLRIRYHQQGASSDVDTVLSTLRYPYPGAEFLWDTRGHAFEDLDVTDSLIIALENYRLVLLDMRTGQKSYRYVACYEALTIVDGRYVYYDDIGWSLYRYDLVQDTSVLFVYHPRSFAYLTMGLEVYDGSIWELFLQPEGTFLFRYEMSTGTVMDSTLMPVGVSRMTIHDGILYMTSWREPFNLLRYDLSAKTFLTPLRAPSPGGEGIRIRDGFFYFNHGWSWIARFPFAELATHGTFDTPGRTTDLRQAPNRGVLIRDDNH